MNKPRDIQREPIQGTPEAELQRTMDPEQLGDMETFVLTGPNKGFTGEMCGRHWTDGKVQIPVHDAEKFARIACYYYGAIRQEDVQMKVLIWGPISDNQWAEYARNLGRTKFPRCSLKLRHPAQFEPFESDADVSDVHAVIHVQGCEFIGEAYQVQGISEIITLPGVVYPEASPDMPPVNPKLPDEPEEEPVVPPEPEVYQNQPIIDRLLAMTGMKLKRYLRSADVSPLLKDRQFVAKMIESEEKDGKGRATVVAMIQKEAKKV